MKRMTRKVKAILSAMIATAVLTAGMAMVKSGAEASLPEWLNPGSWFANAGGDAALPDIFSPSAPETTAPPAADGATWAQRAAALPVIDDAEADAAGRPAYRRASFGEAWADIDGNGCNQRQDVLARDLTEITRATNGCTVLTGTLYDPYTGKTIHFEHDRVAKKGNPGSQGVQIDHIVSLSAAYAGGAWAWPADRRQAFANSLDVLLAVDGKTNTSKSDRGPSTWTPPAVGFKCEYAKRYTEIVSTWELSVSAADRNALINTLTSCGI